MKHRQTHTIGLVVEGDSEFYALPKLSWLVPGCPAIRAANLGGLGSDLSVEAIAKRALPKAKQHFAAGRSRVVLCLDRESRKECAGSFATAISKCLATMCGKIDISVVVADRAFEAWILADAVGLYEREEFKREPKFFCFEGQSGERHRKGTVELDSLLGRPYSKTKDGPRLFEKIRFEQARMFGTGKRGSRSLDKLLRVLGV